MEWRGRHRCGSWWWVMLLVWSAAAPVSSRYARHDTMTLLSRWRCGSVHEDARAQRRGSVPELQRSEACSSRSGCGFAQLESGDRFRLKKATLALVEADLGFSPVVSAAAMASEESIEGELVCRRWKMFGIASSEDIFVGVGWKKSQNVHENVPAPDRWWAIWHSISVISVPFVFQQLIFDVQITILTLQSWSAIFSIVRVICRHWKSRKIQSLEKNAFRVILTLSTQPDHMVSINGLESHENQSVDDTLAQN